MRSLTKLAAIAAVVAIYAGMGAMGSVVSPRSARSGAEWRARSGARPSRLGALGRPTRRGFSIVNARSKAAGASFAEDVLQHRLSAEGATLQVITARWDAVELAFPSLVPRAG